MRLNYPVANLELTFKQQTGDPTGDAGDIYTGYDRFGRAIDLRWRVASTNAHLERVQYGFDRAGRRQWRRRFGVATPFPVFPDLTAEGEGDRYYRYDALGQVLAEDFGDLNLAQSAVAGIPNAGMRWSYDPTGNIRSAQEVIPFTGTGANERTHDRGNRVTEVGGADPILTDRAGRITRLRGSDQPDFQMKWDAWGRLVEVKDASNVVLGSYTYDGMHRRVKRTAAGVTWSVFFNDDWKPIEERRASHPTQAAIQYFWGARHRDDLIRRDRATTAGGAINEIRHVLMDYFSPLAITNGATITERYAFGAFGRRSILNAAGTAVIASSTVAWEFGFHGQFRDSETGLYNYGYRYYVTALGRFLSKDPIMEAGGNNLYRMAGNSAVNKVDWLGLKTMPQIAPTPSISLGTKLVTAAMVGVETAGAILAMTLVPSTANAPEVDPLHSEISSKVDWAGVNKWASEATTQSEKHRREDKIKKCHELHFNYKKAARQTSGYTKLIACFDICLALNGANEEVKGRSNYQDNDCDEVPWGGNADHVTEINNAKNKLGNLHEMAQKMNCCCDKKN